MHVRDFLVTLSLVTAGCAPHAASAEARPGATPTSPAPALQAYRDPVTGAFVPTPPAGTLPPQRAQATAPAAPLTETAAPGGGTMVKLDQRFHGRLTATAGRHGVETSCATSTASR